MARKNQPKRQDFLEGEFNLPKLEEKVLRFWDERHIFEKSLQGNQGKKPFVFYEGPPYANGKPGIHHVLARVAKIFAIERAGHRHLAFGAAADAADFAAHAGADPTRPPQIANRARHSL